MVTTKGDMVTKKGDDKSVIVTPPVGFATLAYGLHHTAY